ncbi:unnamed protein product [Oncorhynchus mykiss]|uniref:Uncharacterized protein n=1 Tax=Oncorhynchus mykiss TaxID=8022 RepID=A0A060Z7T2_ONCMY|nr:unnamed protein product [Oncorhynchus mykiss]
MSPNSEIFGSNRHVFVRHRVGEQMISACVVATVKKGGGGVMVWGCFAGDTDNDPKHISRLCKGYLTKKESDASYDLASTITCSQPN